MFWQSMLLIHERMVLVLILEYGFRICLSFLSHYDPLKYCYCCIEELFERSADNIPRCTLEHCHEALQPFITKALLYDIETIFI